MIWSGTVANLSNWTRLLCDLVASVYKACTIVELNNPTIHAMPVQVPVKASML